MSDTDLDELQKSIAHQLLERGNNVFLSGRSGSGKTFNTVKLINYFNSKGVVYAVSASTGIAGRNLHNSAKTIHSLLGLGIISDLDEYKIKKRKLDGTMADFVSKLEVLIIEEISMLSARFIDVIMYHLKRYGFKGTILTIGDFCQLPPVVNDREYDPNYYYAFQSKGWLFYTFFLEGVKRSTDEKFIEWSNTIRNQDYDLLRNDQDFQDFIKQAIEKEADETFVKLFSSNREVDNENDHQLSLVEGDVKVYTGRFKFSAMASRLPNFRWMKEEDFWKNIIPIKDTKLKLGARVMTTINCPNGNYVNGDIGTIVDFIYSSEDLMYLPMVKLDSSGATVMISNHTFKFEERMGGDYEVIATIDQLPIRLAYAITIHKSQGLTLEKMYIDASNFFLPEQFYVAWTRSSNPDNLIVRNFDLDALERNKRVFNLPEWFYNEVYRFQNKILDEDDTLSARAVC